MYVVGEEESAELGTPASVDGDNEFFKKRGVNGGGMVARWLALLPHSKKVLGFESRP